MSTAADGSRLIAFGLQPTVRPTQDADYQELLAAYRNDQGFEALVVEIAAGLNLRILGASDLTGLVLGANDRTQPPFGATLRDLTVGRSPLNGVKDRLVHGLAILGIACVCFPREEDLQPGEDLRRVSALDVDELIRELARKAQREAADAGEDTDPDAEAPHLEPAYQEWVNRPSVQGTLDGRAAPNTTQRAITRAFEWLVAQGMLVERSRDEGGTFLATERFRVQVLELAAGELWSDIHKARQADDGIGSTPRTVGDEEAADV